VWQVESTGSNDDATPFNGDGFLSMNDAETTAAAPGSAPSAPSGLTRDAQWRWEPRVLVVDDDPVCQLAARRLFKNLGIAADVVSDGADAVRVSGEWPYVAVFMDCGTEAVDGYRTARQIRARAGLDHSPPVVAVTSLSREVCLASGMDHHIAKPLRLETLQAECERLGLIPRPGVAPEPAAARSASSAPLLESPPGQGAGGATAELAATFAHDAVSVLPALWRAANVGDLDVLKRAAADLAGRAEEAGAARVAVLCRELSAAAAGGRADAAAELERTVRQALRLTAGAARTQLESGPGSAAAEPVEDPNGSGAVVRVVIADDDPLARMAIEAMIKRGERLELVGSAADVPQIVELAAATRPDVAVVDFIMPGGGGPEAARQIQERSPGTRIVGLTAADGPDAYLAMLRAGASGLLVKGGSAERLVEMIHRAHERGAD
jgi:CheY-like chemotaxis protein